MAAHSLDLRLPEPERRRAAALATAWRDFLYVPGPGFTSPLEPGLYRSNFVIAPVEGPAVRLSSFVVPAFGGELCRLRLEALVSYRAENLGSFFEPSRTGVVYRLADRSRAAARPPERPEWRYGGPALTARLGRVGRPRLLRERVRGSDFSWEADRGFVLAGVDSVECLLLSVPEPSEHVLFLPAPGLYRTLLEPAASAPPGASVRELLGYGAWPRDAQITLASIPLRAAAT